MKCGGIIFNRHKWRYFGNTTRICTKCAEMERGMDDRCGGLFWYSITFTKFQKRVKDHYDYLDREAKKWNKSREQAEMWLYNNKLLGA